GTTGEWKALIPFQVSGIWKLLSGPGYLIVLTSSELWIVFPLESHPITTNSTSIAHVCLFDSKTLVTRRYQAVLDFWNLETLEKVRTFYLHPTRDDAVDIKVTGNHV